MVTEKNPPGTNKSTCGFASDIILKIQRLNSAWEIIMITDS